MKLWCIHGNLQRATVWDAFAASFKQQTEAHEIVALDLYDTVPGSMDEWVADFIHRVESTESASGHALLGYSLGGRLALQALLAAPQLWRGAVVVGADPGIKVDAEGDAQLARDRQWGDRFAREPWSTVCADWDDLPVFCGVPCPTPRPQCDFDPATVKRVFGVFSKGHQPDLRDALTSPDLPPILYISGERDQKYTAIGTDLQGSCAAVTHRIVGHAGHRVPWEEPDAFAKAVNEFLAELSWEH